MQKSFYTVSTLVRINTRRFFRDRLAIFFTIVFPLIFLFVFGGLNSGSGDVSFRVGLVNQSESAFAKQFVTNAKANEILEVDPDVTTLAAAKEKMTKSQLDATIVLPDGFGEIKPGDDFPSGQAKVVYTSNNEQSATALNSILEAQFKAINSKFVNTATPFSVT